LRNFYFLKKKYPLHGSALCQSPNPCDSRPPALSPPFLLARLCLPCACVMRGSVLGVVRGRIPKSFAPKKLLLTGFIKNRENKKNGQFLI
jgi:hypothetical protein